MNQDSIISARNLDIGYFLKNEKLCLYKNLNFDLFEGELVCLIGANGAGKSTLLRTISKMQDPLGGEILLKGKKLSQYRGKELSQYIGLVLTDRTTSGGFTVRELVELGRYPYTGFFGTLNEEDDVIVNQSLESVGILHKANSYIADLSDGERQKAMIAKALSQECPIIMLDEPTAFLDIESKIEIMNLLHKLAHTENKTILLSTHDIDLSFLLADKLWMLTKNAQLITGITEDIILSGKIDNFFQNENIVFNKFTGAFYPVRTSDQKIYVDAKGELLFWTINMLLRLGYDYTEDKEKAIFIISVSQNNSIEIIEHDITLSFQRFEELSVFLKERKFSVASLPYQAAEI